MNPLVIKGSIGKQVDLRLSDFVVLRYPKFFTDVLLKLGKAVDDKFRHGG
jgi:hypothetical protein